MKQYFRRHPGPIVFFEGSASLRLNDLKFCEPLAARKAGGTHPSSLKAHAGAYTTAAVIPPPLRGARAGSV